MNDKFKKLLKDAIVVSVDLDGTLCEDQCWTSAQCLDATPKYNIIEMINKIGFEKYIVIFTSRRDELIPSTLKWLRKHGVKFQAISNNKSASDLYIDDKTLDVEELL